MSLRLLYVEDEPDDVFLLRRAIDSAHLDVTVDVCQNGESAVDWVTGYRQYADRNSYPLPDLLVIDLKLPIRNGFEVLDAARRSRYLKNTPALIYSSSLQQKDIATAFALGANAFIGKSSDCNGLVSTLEKLLEMAKENRSRAAMAMNDVAA